MRNLSGMVRVFSSGLLLSVLVSCSGAILKISEAHPPRRDGDPVLLGRAFTYIEKGNLALARNDAVTAEKMAKDSIDILPLFEGYYLLGMAERSLQKPEEALQALLKAESLMPDVEQLLLSLGLLYGARGDHEQALNRFNRLLILKPDDPVYNYRTGVIQKEKKDYKKAISYLKKADVDGFEFRDQALMQLGDVSLELREFDDADAYFARARALNPKLAEAAAGGESSRTARLLDQGNTAFRRKEYGAAEAAYREATVASPKSATPHIQLGIVLLARNDLKKARESFEQALKLKSDSREARAFLASTARRLGDFGASARVIEDGLKTMPDDPELLNQLGLHHAALGEREQAAVIFEKILQKNETFLSARKNLLLQYIDLGRPVDARRQLVMLQKQEPSNTEWKDVDQLIQIQEILERGHVLFRKAQYKRAEQEYRRALAVKKDYVPTHLALATAQMHGGDSRSAEKSFRLARKIEPENPEALEGLLTLYSRTGDHRAHQTLEHEIRQIGAQHPEVLLAFARQKEEAGQDTEAMAQYRTLLVRMPGNAFILRRMASIEIRNAIEANKKNHFDEAATHLAAAQKLDPSHPGIARNRAIIEENRRYGALVPEIAKAEAAYQKGDYALAEQLFARLHRQWPRPSFLVRLAEIRFETGREAEGQAMLIEALKKDPVGLEFREALYSRLLDRRQLDEAEKGFQKIVADDESAYFSLYKLGVIDLLRKDYKDALGHLQQALLYRSDFLAARIARGVVFYQKGQPDEARREFDEAKKIEQKGQPGQPIAMLNLALMEWNAGNDRAEKALSQLSSLYPDFADPHYHLAYMAYSRQQWQTALDEINKAIELERTPDYLFARIEILGKMRSPRELQNASREFLKEYPGDERGPGVRRILASGSGQKDFVEPALRYPVGTDQVYSLPSSFLIVRADSIVGVERGSDRVMFHRHGDIRSHLLDRWLVLLEGQQLVWLDPESGEELRRHSVPASTCAIAGSAERPLVLVAKDCNKGPSVLQALDGTGKRPLQGGVVLAGAADGFVLVEGSRIIPLSVSLEEAGEGWKAPGTVSMARRLGEGLVARAGESLFFLGPDLQLRKEVRLDGREIHMDGSVLLLGRDSTVEELNGSGEKIRSFRLPAGAYRALFSTGAGRLAALDGNDELVVVDSTGKVFLREAVKKSEASVFRLYSAADTQ